MAFDFGLYKDRRGRRCYLVARNPGKKCAFFIEGQPAVYHWFTEEETRANFTPYKPPRDTTPEPAFLCPPKRLIRRLLNVRLGPGHWNGWVGVEIQRSPDQFGSRFYILPMSKLVQHVEPTTPETRYDRIRLDALL